MLPTYNTMIPLYMKEDEQFSKVYKYIENIFEQVNETCKAMKEDMIFNSNSSEFLKVLSLFGQINKFKQLGVQVVGLAPLGYRWAILKTDPSEPINIDINLSTLASYYSAKFNTLKNNFNGTFINLKESLIKIFNYDNTNNESMLSITCSQDIVKDSQDVDHPHLILTIEIDLNLEDKFPPEEAYLVGGEYPVWDYRDIDPAWLNDPDHPENIEMYNYYIDFLNLLTLFQNNYFKLDILGVITEFEISGNARILKWNDSIWNQSLWSGTRTEEE